MDADYLVPLILLVSIGVILVTLLVVTFRPPKKLKGARMKKYRFYEIVGKDRLGPLIAETDRFRDVERKRRLFAGKIAIVYEQTEEEVKSYLQEVEYAQSF